MIVVLQDGRLSLQQGDDFARFSLHCLDRDEPAAGMGPDRIEFAERAVSWIPVETLVRLRGASADARWRENLRHMVDTARRFGWFDEEGRRIRAHVEHRPA